MPTASGLVNACSQPFSHCACARLSSSAVTVRWPAIRRCAATSHAPCPRPARGPVRHRRSAPGFGQRPGEGEGARRQPASVRRLCSRPAGVSPSTSASISAAAKSALEPGGTWYAAISSGAPPLRRSVTLRSPSCAGSSVYCNGSLRVGFGDLAEVLRHPGQHLRRVELAGHDQRRVVGLVVLAVEGLQARDVDVFDVGTRADRRLAVVVPVVHGRQRALHQDAAGAVLAASPSRCAPPSSRCRGPHAR